MSCFRWALLYFSDLPRQTESNGQVGNKSNAFHRIMRGLQYIYMDELKDDSVDNIFPCVAHRILTENLSFRDRIGARIIIRRRRNLNDKMADLVFPDGYNIVFEKCRTKKAVVTLIDRAGALDR